MIKCRKFQLENLLYEQDGDDDDNDVDNKSKAINDFRSMIITMANGHQ